MFSLRVCSIVVLAIVFAFAAGGPLSTTTVLADEPPLSPPALVASEPELDTGRVIVQFRPGTPAANKRAVHAQHGGTLVQTLGGTGMEVVQIRNARATQAVAAAYARNPNVVFAEPDAIVPLADTPLIPNDTYYSVQWQHPATDSPEA